MGKLAELKRSAKWGWFWATVWALLTGWYAWPAIIPAIGAMLAGTCFLANLAHELWMDRVNLDLTDDGNLET